MDEQAIVSLSTSFLAATNRTDVASALSRYGPCITGAESSTLAVVSGRGVIDIALPAVDARSTGVDCQGLKGWIELALDESTPLGSAILRRRSILLPCPEAVALRYRELETWSKNAGIFSCASVPIVGSRGESIGAIGFAWWLPQAFEPAQVRFLERLGEYVGFTLERVGRLVGRNT